MSDFIFAIQHGSVKKGSFVPEFYLMADDDGLNLCYTDSDGSEITVLYVRSDNGQLVLMEDVGEESRLALDDNHAVVIA